MSRKRCPKDIPGTQPWLPTLKLSPGVFAGWQNRVWRLASARPASRMRGNRRPISHENWPKYRPTPQRVCLCTTEFHTNVISTAGNPESPFGHLWPRKLSLTTGRARCTSDCPNSNVPPQRFPKPDFHYGFVAFFREPNRKRSPSCLTLYWQQLPANRCPNSPAYMMQIGRRRGLGFQAGEFTGQPRFPAAFSRLNSSEGRFLVDTFVGPVNDAEELDFAARMRRV